MKSSVYWGTNYDTTEGFTARVSLHERFSVNKTGWHRWVGRIVDPKDTDKILEVGCGLGVLWSTISDEIPTNLSLVLSDVSPAMVDAAQTLLGPLFSKAIFEIADVQDLPYADREFDKIIANHCLYHAADKGLALSSISKKLAPDGVAFISTNGSSHLQEIEELLKSCEPNYTRDKPLDNFNLDTGQELLAAFFGSVQLMRYPDRLRVTDTQALMRHIMSLPKSKEFCPKTVDTLKSLISARIKQNGAVDVTKDSGIFVCSVPLQ
jgi:SAM-dependent methyltransferase